MRTNNGTIENKARFRRVSHRPGQVYSRIKQVIAVTVGACQAAWNLTQEILDAKSTAAYSITEPAAHIAANRQAIVNGEAPGTLRRRQAYTASVNSSRTVKRDGQIWGV